MAVFFNDTFDEASDTGLASHTPNIGGAYSHNANSASSGGTVTAGSGKAVFPSGSINIFNNAATPGAADYTVSGNIRWEGSDGRIDCILRASGSNGYRIFANFGGTYTIYRDSTLGVTVATGTHTATTGFTDYAFSISVTGTTISFTLNGTTISGTDSTWSSAGLVAIGGREMSYVGASANDSTASNPVLSSPTASGTGPTQATIGVTTDTAPTTTVISYQILPAASGAPSAATIVGAPDGTIATGSAGALTKAITGLTTNTAVKVHFAQSSTSNVVSSASFTPQTLASSGSPSAQSGTAGGSITWSGATPHSLLTNTGNGSGAWSIVSSAGFSVVPSINTATGVLSGGTLSGAGTYAPQVRYTDSSTVPTAQTVTFTLTLTVGAAGDVTAPTLSGATASGGTLTCAGAVSTNEANGTLYAVFCASGTAPTALQVEAGQDSAGAAALRAASQAVSATGAQVVGSGSITAGTRYAFFMHKDAAGNRSAVAASASFTVTTGADTTPPVMTSASVTGGTLSATGSISSNEAGTLWWKMDGNATATDPGAGSESGAGWSSQIMAPSVNAVNFSTQPAGTRYGHFIGVDAAGNRAAVVNASGTISAGAGVYTALTDIIAVAGIAQASTLVYFTWCPSGRPGGITSPVNGSTTTNSEGRAIISHTVAGDGFVLIGTRPGPVVSNDRVFAQFLTLA